jgi:hypothetical protein
MASEKIEKKPIQVHSKKLDPKLVVYTVRIGINPNEEYESINTVLENGLNGVDFHITDVEAMTSSKFTEEHKRYMS